jgi:hypothetical protein
MDEEMDLSPEECWRLVRRVDNWLDAERGSSTPTPTKEESDTTCHTCGHRLITVDVSTKKKHRTRTPAGQTLCLALDFTYSQSSYPSQHSVGHFYAITETDHSGPQCISSIT